MVLIGPEIIWGGGRGAGGNLVFSETLGNIEPFLIPGPHHENVKDMQIINYRVYVDSSYYNVHKFRSLF